MEYRKIGKWGVRVSEVALGSWLTYGGSVDEKTSIELINHAFEQGINFFDTANVYALGEAEKVVGMALSSFAREQIVLATKVFGSMGNGPNDRGLSRKHVFEQCNASLKRLKTDYIDLYQCHRYDSDVPMDELVTTMDILTRQGKILYWGVSEWPADKIQDAVDTASQLNAPLPVSNQPCYNMLERKMEKFVLPTCQKNGLGQVVFSPLAQGVLTGKYKPGQALPTGSRATNNQDGVFLRNHGFLDTQVLELVQELLKIASEAGLTLAQLSLAWCLRLPNISSVIIGATKKHQIDENIKASSINLSAEVVEKIERILEGQVVPQ